MSSYLKGNEWEQLLDQDDDSLQDYYEELEETDKRNRRKRQTKMREYEGYADE